MRATDILTLFDYNYWANRQVVAAAAEVPVEQFLAPSIITWRNLRGTLVHTLDVEWSWRIRLRGESPELWETSLSPEDYPTVPALADHWRRDEEAMQTWLRKLDDADLTRTVDLGDDDHYPLWYYLVHVVTHSAQQRRDATVLLTNFGRPPGELEFLYCADWARDSGPPE